LIRHVKNLFCPPSFDRFEYVPSNGASCGIIIVWKSSKFSAHVVFQSSFAISMECTSVISGATCTLANVYAPCTLEGRQSFLDWFKNIDVPDNMDWLIIGDFNLTGISPEAIFRTCSTSTMLLVTSDLKG
jgi:hypothetical protein